MLTVPHAATRDAMSVLIRGWKLIAGFAVPFGLIALLMCSLQKPVYEASATLYVTSGGDTSRVAASYDGIMGAAGRVASYSKLIDSDRVLARAVKAAGLNMTVAQAKNVVQAEVVPQSILIKVSAKDQNPEVAQRFANALAQSMIDTIAALDSAHRWRSIGIQADRGDPGHPQSASGVADDIAGRDTGDDRRLVCRCSCSTDPRATQQHCPGPAGYRENPRRAAARGHPP